MTTQHAKRPGSPPAIAQLHSVGQYLVDEQVAQDGAVIAFVDARHGDGELHVVELVFEHADGVLEMVGEQEEGRCIFCFRLTQAQSVSRSVRMTRHH